MYWGEQEVDIVPVGVVGECAPCSNAMYSVGAETF